MKNNLKEFSEAPETKTIYNNFIYGTSQDILTTYYVIEELWMGYFDSYLRNCYPIMKRDFIYDLYVNKRERKVLEYLTSNKLQDISHSQFPLKVFDILKECARGYHRSAVKYRFDSYEFMPDMLNPLFHKEDRLSTVEKKDILEQSHEILVEQCKSSTGINRDIIRLWKRDYFPSLLDSPLKTQKQLNSQGGGYTINQVTYSQKVVRETFVKNVRSKLSIR